ncbi:MAG: nucleotidyltransferase family protein [Acidobacteriota bacterium]
MAQALAGLILAGGAGERFGGPKAFALLPGGQSFLDRCAATLAAAGAHPIVATLPPQTAGLAGTRVDALALPAAGLDMFASLRLGLERLLADRRWTVVAMLPVDHPLVAAATVIGLAAVPAPAVVPVWRNKRGHPVCLARAVAARIVAGTLPGPTLRDALRAAGREDLAVDDPGVVANCNTPERLAAALADSALR